MIHVKCLTQCLHIDVLNKCKLSLFRQFLLTYSFSVPFRVTFWDHVTSASDLWVRVGKACALDCFRIWGAQTLECDLEFTTPWKQTIFNVFPLCRVKSKILGSRLTRELHDDLRSLILFRLRATSSLLFCLLPKKECCSKWDFIPVARFD